MTGLKELSAHYDARASRYGKDVRSCNYQSRWSFLQRQALVRKLLKEPQGKRILDAGCGPGLFTDFLAPGNERIGVDLSAQMLQLAGHSLKSVLADAEQLPFQNSCFQIALAIETLQHLAQPEKIIRELVRVLAGGGDLILSALNRESLLHRSMRFVTGGYEGFHFHPLERIAGILNAEKMIIRETVLMAYPLPLSWKVRRSDHFSLPCASSWIIRAQKTEMPA